jgi:hypothetical protein
MIIADLMKQRLNQGKSANVYFWRDQTGNEIDCILDYGETLKPVEIKLSQTLSSDYFAMLLKWQKITKVSEDKSYVVYGGETSMARKGGLAVSWKDIGGLNQN